LVQGMDAPLLTERIVEVLLQHSLSSDRMAEALVDRLGQAALVESFSL